MKSTTWTEIIKSPYRYWLNDNECDLPNNVTECDYDGGDCLLDNPSEVTCDLPKLVGNGVCNQQLNHEGCEFDGGDCIDPGCLYASKNDYCYGPANWPSCDYDYGDCIWVNAGCPEENGVGDGICHNGNNVEHCGFDGGDCEGHVQDQCFRPDWFGDQGCDDENNLEICGWDGGDCYYPNRSKLQTEEKSTF